MGSRRCGLYPRRKAPRGLARRLGRATSFRPIYRSPKYGIAALCGDLYIRFATGHPVESAGRFRVGPHQTIAKRRQTHTSGAVQWVKNAVRECTGNQLLPDHIAGVFARILGIYCRQSPVASCESNNLPFACSAAFSVCPHESRTAGSQSDEVLGSSSLAACVQVALRYL